MDSRRGTRKAGKDQVDNLLGTREAPGRQERTIWTAWEAPGRQKKGLDPKPELGGSFGYHDPIKV